MYVPSLPLLHTPLFFKSLSLTQGFVYTWGESSYGQLGLGPEVVARNSCPLPRRVMLLKVCTCIYVYVCMYICVYVCFYVCMSVGNVHGVCVSFHEPSINL